ncbi:SRPBCC domain-containing protein [Paraburkholderia sp. MM6662-R1]|uniref:SRPBCC domain-containing protein n=1 Tax=Paraburkholderia sp. MM6662-R1 TaxID=2991066 RepID=UPI003D21F759
MNHMANKARAVADLTEGIIVATVEIEAPAERIFEALTTGDEVLRWWGSSDTYRTTEWTGEVRPGGRWRANGVGVDGKPFSVGGEFLEVIPARKLVQTWRPDWDERNTTTTVTIRLDPIEGGTRLTLWHKGFSGHPESCGGHGAGWERVLGWLAGHVTPPAPAQQHFLCRLLPPRATFAHDMDADEAEVMKHHAEYLTGLLHKGVAVVFGPVADPAGAWGVGIFRASGEAQMHALCDADPAILSGRGFRYEVLPMLRAVYRD